MTKEEKIEQEIRKTLDQFERAEKLPANPWFFTRVQTRLKNRQNKKPGLAGLLKPALLALLFILNTATGIWYLTGAGTAVSAQSNDRQQLVEVLANDLNMQQNENVLPFNK